MGRTFELRIYHSGLKYLFEQPSLNVRKNRWLEFLSKYDFDIKSIKGKNNKVVDALNRRVHEMHVTTISMCISDLKRRILQGLALDEHYAQVKEGLQQRNLPLKLKEYKMGEDGFLLFMDKFHVPNSHELRSFSAKGDVHCAICCTSSVLDPTLQISLLPHHEGCFDWTNFPWLGF
jgi:hypothetical protein